MMPSKVAKAVVRRFVDRWEIDRHDGVLVWKNRFRDEDGPPVPLTDSERLYLTLATGKEYENRDDQ